MVRSGGRAEVSGGVQLQSEDLDPFLSTTARLGGQAPFQVVSDGRYLLLFRQSVDETHPDALFRLTGGGASGDAARTDYARTAYAKVPLVTNTMLCDRFVQVGATVKPVLEVRYQRSRSKTVPASSSDTLGTRDLDGDPFYEPTRQLSFVRNVADGEFAVMLLPTQVDGVSRWQLFAVNKVTGRPLIRSTSSGPTTGSSTSRAPSSTPVLTPGTRPQCWSVSPGWIRSRRSRWCRFRCRPTGRGRHWG